MPDEEGLTAPQPLPVPVTPMPLSTPQASQPTVAPTPAPTISPDGRFYWDGVAWQPLLPSSSAVPTLDQAEYSARFYLSPARVAILFLVSGPVYFFWWLWRLYHHVKHEQLPRPHSFWTILVPLYNLKTMSDEFRTVHEEGSRALGRTPFALPAAYILWLGGLIFEQILGRSTGPADAVYYLISSGLFAIVAYWVQSAANRYLAIRLAGRPMRGLSPGELISALLGGLLTLAIFAGAFLRT